MDIRKAFLIFTGTVFVSLGVLGMFLPLVPTTVFLLLAAYCYSRSSERFHNWLLTNRFCGPYIHNYQSGRGISVRQKASTLFFLWASIGLSIWIVQQTFWLVLLLLAVALGVTIHILWLKTYRPEVETAELASADKTA
ncbi:MAG TPA: YbaN family protein [Pyrinomonadaceae bacterium]|nr:YbaN family protein [Pyrinomonadaceae bacterium]